MYVLSETPQPERTTTNSSSAGGNEMVLLVTAFVKTKTTYGNGEYLQILMDIDS